MLNLVQIDLAPLGYIINESLDRLELFNIQFVPFLKHTVIAVPSYRPHPCPSSRLLSVKMVVITINYIGSSFNEKFAR